MSESKYDVSSDQHRSVMIDLINRKTVGPSVDANLLQQYETEY